MSGTVGAHGNGNDNGEVEGIVIKPLAGDPGPKTSKIVRSGSLHSKLSPAKDSEHSVVRRTRSITISEPQTTRVFTKFSKNSRRSRGGYGRGLPKKGGAGGKGVWGKPGSELLHEPLDPHDPNYDSETMDDNVKLEEVNIEMSDEEIKSFMESLVLEYFEHGDTSEVDHALTEKAAAINFKKRYLLVVEMIELALDHKASHREMTSVLLSNLYQECITQTDICRGFERILCSLPDLVLDCPDAPLMIGNFMARAVADDCVPPKLLHELKHHVDCTYAIKSLERGELLLSMKQGMMRLDNVWGVGGGLRPVRALVKQMSLLLQEFILSGDTAEAVRCLKELEVPHFHHELVFEAVVMAIERSDCRSISELVRLLGFMFHDGVITSNQMHEGFVRVFENISDIELDVPMAHSLLEKIIQLSLSSGVINRDITLKLPTRARKRFVSEGDGGRIKDPVFTDTFNC